jgi:hypothetical protein
MPSDGDLVDRLQRLRQAHAVLAGELATARRALTQTRQEVAQLRLTLELERDRRPFRDPLGSNG